jgi:hypothetical protein
MWDETINDQLLVFSHFRPAFYRAAIAGLSLTVLFFLCDIKNKYRFLVTILRSLAFVPWGILGSTTLTSLTQIDFCLHKLL